MQMFPHTFQNICGAAGLPAAQVVARRAQHRWIGLCSWAVPHFLPPDAQEGLMEP